MFVHLTVRFGKEERKQEGGREGRRVRRCFVGWSRSRSRENRRRRNVHSTKTPPGCI